MSPQEQFDEAIRLEDEGHRELALGVWRQLTETYPTRNAFLRLGGIAKELGLLDDAGRAFKQALQIDARSALAMRELGLLAMDRRDYEIAGSYLKKACQIDEDPGGFSLLGAALAKTGKSVEAEQAYRRALTIDSKYEEAYFNLGVLLRRKHPSEAEALFRTALELDPGYACAHRELGYVLTHRGASPEGEGHLRKAIELDPGNAWAHIYLGTSLWIGADVDAATAEFRLAAQLEPEWEVPLWSLGNIHENALGDLDLAQSFFEQALQLNPDSQMALKGLGRLFKKRGRNDLAKGYLGKALLLDPNDERVRALISEIGGDRSV